MKRGVTGLRPPPGGAQAEQIVTSWEEDDLCEKLIICGAITSKDPCFKEYIYK